MDWSIPSSMAQQTVKFTFDPGTNDVTADDIVRALKTVLGAAGNLSDWHIHRISFASPLQVEATCDRSVYDPIATFVKQMKNIADGKKPRYGLRGPQAKLLDSIDTITRQAFGSIRIAPARVKPIQINHAAIERAREMVDQKNPSLMIHAREQMGQLRGELEEIVARRGERIRFGIRDRVSKGLIPCIIPEDAAHLLDIAKQALTHRVVVSGLIHFGDRSQPTSIRAASIEPINEFTIPFEKLPRVRLTEDGDSVGHVRRLRDG